MRGSSEGRRLWAALLVACLSAPLSQAVAQPGPPGSPAAPGRPADPSPQPEQLDERLAEPPDTVWSEVISVGDRAVVFRLDGWYCFGSELGDLIARVRWRTARLEQGVRLLVPDATTGRITYAPVAGLRDPASRFREDLSRAQRALNGAGGQTTVERFEAQYQLRADEPLQPPLNPRPAYRARHRARGCLDEAGLNALLNVERQAAAAFMRTVRQLEEALGASEEARGQPEGSAR